MSRQLTYGHFGVVGGIVCIAVGFEQMVTRPLVSMTFTHLNLLYGGAILLLVSMVYMRYAMSKVWRVARIAAIGVLLMLLYVSLLAPGDRRHRPAGRRALRAGGRREALAGVLHPRRRPGPVGRRGLTTVRGGVGGVCGDGGTRVDPGTRPAGAARELAADRGVIRRG